MIPAQLLLQLTPQLPTSPTTLLCLAGECLNTRERSATPVSGSGSTRFFDVWI